MKAKKWMGSMLLLLVAAACFFVMFYYKDAGKLPRDQDTEFSGKGSLVRMEELTELQTESLYKLCKVWGYAKYRHPSVIDGSLHWDYELLRVMPEILSCENREEVNGVLADWLNGFPFEIPTVTEETKEWLSIQKEAGCVELNTDWISDKAFLGEELCDYLNRLSQVFISEREHGFASFPSLFVTFDNEMDIPFVDSGDDGVKLLALFRLWNIYEYYSPNISITKTDWDQVLLSSIPKMVQTESKEDYVLAIAEAAAQTGDGHLTVKDRDLTVHNYYGAYYLPCNFEQAEGRVVITYADPESGLVPGDVICEIDGISIEERLQTLSRYTALPEAHKFTLPLQYSLLKSEQEQTNVRVLREGKELTLSVKAEEKAKAYENPYKNGLLKEQIGYIDPSALKHKDLEKLMKEFQNTKGLIVDLRYYPASEITYELAEYVNPDPAVFVQMSFANPALPGSFWTIEDFLISGSGAMEQQKQMLLGAEEAEEDRELLEESLITPTLENEKAFYQGKLMILMDQRSQSAAEFAVMSLRKAPGAMVIGSPSFGADGNIAGLSLPGGVSMNISGLGVYTPEWGQTQRIGVQPDITCEKTIQGIREGRDELIEKAIELIEEEHERNMP